MCSLLALLLPQSEAQEAMEVGLITKILSCLLKRWNEQAEGGEKGKSSIDQSTIISVLTTAPSLLRSLLIIIVNIDTEAYQKLDTLEKVLMTYQSTPADQHEERSALASKLLIAQAEIKEAFAKKVGGSGSS